jgi:Fe2+ transport system protein FeoA
MINTLWHMRRGESCVINGFEPSLSDRYRTRLVELGFRPGATVACVMAPRLGAPKLYQVSTTVYSLESDIAKLVHTGGAAA